MQGIPGINGAGLEQILDINADFGILSMARGVCGLRKRGNPRILMKLSLFGQFSILAQFQEVTLEGCHLPALGQQQFRTFLAPEFASRLRIFPAPAGFGLCSFV